MPRLPEQRKAAVPANLQWLSAALQDVSGVMVRYTLQYHGLEVPATGSVADLQRLAIAYVEDGKLTADDVRSLILDSREYSAKRAYLFAAPRAALAQWTPPDPAAVVPNRAAGRLQASVGPERLGYIVVSGPRIRAAFTELHQDQFVDFDAGTVTRVPVQKVIVLEADSGTGFVTVLLDAPGRRHPHGQRKSAYYAYWKQRAAAFFQVNLDDFPLVKSLIGLEKDNRIKIPYTMARTAGGKVALTGIETDDVRALPEYAQLQQRRIAHDQDEYLWVPQIAVPPASTGIPLRDIKTDIAVSAGEIRFMQHALACEVNYVLEQLYAHA